VLFVGEGDGRQSIYRVKEDGSELQKVVRTSNSTFNVSPDGKWIVVSAADPTHEVVALTMLYPVGGGSATLVCACKSANSDRPGPSVLSWSPDMKFLYLGFERSIYAVLLPPGEVLPPLPRSGLRTEQEVAALPGARLIPQPDAFAGPNPSVYAFTQAATQRNIYRVAVP